MTAANDNGGVPVKVIDFDSREQVNTPDVTDEVREALVSEALLQLPNTKVASFAMVMIGEDGKYWTAWAGGNLFELIGASHLLAEAVTTEQQLQQWGAMQEHEPTDH